MWICKECGTEVFEVKTRIKEVISSINKNGIADKIVYRDKVSQEGDTFYRCDGCGNTDQFLEEIAEWEE